VTERTEKVSRAIRREDKEEIKAAREERRQRNEERYPTAARELFAYYWIRHFSRRYGDKYPDGVQFHNMRPDQGKLLQRVFGGVYYNDDNRYCMAEDEVIKAIVVSAEQIQYGRVAFLKEIGA
jgi:hypothetical protein